MSIQMRGFDAMLKAVLFFACFLLAAQASGNQTVKLDHAPIDPNNQASLQRGAKVFVNYCLSCHSASFMRYNRLADIGLTESQIRGNLLFSAEKVGDLMTVAMVKKEAKQWFGATPPDLSVQARAYPNGADWLYTYLRGFYRDESRPTGWNNIVYDKVAMPHVLWQLQGEQALKIGEVTEHSELHLVKPGLMEPAEYDALVADLVNYLVYMAEPGKAKRMSLGLLVLAYLAFLTIVLYCLKKEFWKDVH